SRGRRPHRRHLGARRLGGCARASRHRAARDRGRRRGARLRGRGARPDPGEVLMSASTDTFTGERLPGGGDTGFGVDMERHLAAYRWAAELAPGRSVLDAGCGEGYGASMLAERAERVLGADRDEAIAIASARYRHPRLAFRAIDLMTLPSLGERFDVVVS